MKCKKIKRLLTPYLDKELKDQHKIQLIEEHLDTCSECREQYQKHFIIKQFIKQKVKKQADIIDLPGILQTIDKKNIQRSARKNLILDIIRNEIIPVAAAAAAVILVIMSIQMLKNHTAPSSVEQYLLTDMTNYEIQAVMDKFNTEAYLLE